MANEREGRKVIEARLAEVGYAITVSDSRIGGSKMRLDVLAYASNAEGDLVPWLAVEAKNGPKATPQDTVAHLLKAREVLGTVEHYAVINGAWFRADRGLRSFERVDGPVEPAHGVGGVVSDLALASTLIREGLWQDARKGSSPHARVDYFFPPAELLSGGGRDGVESTSGQVIPIRQDILWRARRQALAAFALNGEATSRYTTAPVIADAVARLIGAKLQGTVLDPFCGTGNFLWSALDRALEDEQSSPAFVGNEVNVELAELADQIARSAPLLVNIMVGDSFRSDLPFADVVVAAPPFGPSMHEPWELLDSTQTRDLETAALDLCLRRLNPGGRAVVLMPHGFTFKKAVAGYRDYVARDFRVGALIGLPVVSLGRTQMRGVLLVIDKAEPGPTFVAQLGEDWEAQLSSTGAAMTAALEHLDDER